MECHDKLISIHGESRVQMQGFRVAGMCRTHCIISKIRYIMNHHEYEQCETLVRHHRYGHLPCVSRHLKVISEASAGSADKNRSLAKRLAEEGISNGIRGPQIDSSCISSNGVHTGATP